MKIEHQQIGTVTVLSPIGPLVDDDAEQFADELNRRLGAAAARIVVAMHEVPYLDSSALEALLLAAEELSAQAQRLKLARVTSTCREAMELTGLADRFQYFEEVQDAVRSYL